MSVLQRLCWRWPRPHQRRHERKAVLDALRPAVEEKLGPNVEFVVAASSASRTAGRSSWPIRSARAASRSTAGASSARISTIWTACGWKRSCRRAERPLEGRRLGDRRDRRLVLRRRPEEAEARLRLLRGERFFQPGRDDRSPRDRRRGDARRRGPGLRRRSACAGPAPWSRTTTSRRLTFCRQFMRAVFSWPTKQPLVKLTPLSSMALHSSQSRSPSSARPSHTPRRRRCSSQPSAGSNAGAIQRRPSA